MERSPSPIGTAVRYPLQAAGWILAGLLLALLWAPNAALLWGIWQSSDSLSHGPVLVLIAAGLLWIRRGDLKQWDRAWTPGLVLLTVSALLHIAAGFADIVFLKSLSLLGVTLGAAGYLGGRLAFRAAAGPIGLLVFTLPWPTTLVERIAFPLQLTSSAYAALLGGMIGLPIHREGVHLSVMSAAGDKPIYSVLVAQQCSGLNSLTVLLALGYLIAMHTPTGWSRRALLVAVILPLALAANAVRMTLILLAGALHGADLAQWIHDHEAPVLIFFCSLGLMALRSAILAWGRPDSGREATGGAATPPEAAGAPRTGTAAEARSREARSDAPSELLIDLPDTEGEPIDPLPAAAP